MCDGGLVMMEEEEDGAMAAGERDALRCLPIWDPCGTYRRVPCALSHRGYVRLVIRLLGTTLRLVVIGLVLCLSWDPWHVVWGTWHVAAGPPPELFSSISPKWRWQQPYQAQLGADFSFGLMAKTRLCFPEGLTKCSHVYLGV